MLYTLKTIIEERLSRYTKLFYTIHSMYFIFPTILPSASNALFFSHNVTLLLQNSASSASKIIRRKYKNNFEYLLK